MMYGWLLAFYLNDKFMHSCPKYKANPGTEKRCGKELTYHRIKICKLCSKLSLGKILLRSALNVCSSHRSVTTLLESKKNGWRMARKNSNRQGAPQPCPIVWDW